MGIVSKNAFLSESEMQQNASYIWQYLSSKGWSMNAVAGMLGNMETESTINPAIWQNHDAGNTSLGFGLVQWTPATKLINWANGKGLDYTEMDTQLKRILWELENGEQYYPTDSYPLSFAAFSTSNQTPEYLAQAFLLNYERPADQTQPARSTQARKWYTYLGGVGTGGGSEEPEKPDTPVITVRKSRKLPLWMMYQTIRRV